MQIKDFKQLDPFHQEIILLLERIARALENGMKDED